MFYRRKKAIQVWNDMWVSKWWSFYILLFLYLSVSVSFDLTQIIPHAVFANFYFTLSIHISPSPSFPIFFLPLQFHYTILVSPFIFPYLPISLSPSFLSNLSTHIHTSPSSRLYDWFRLDSVIWGRLQITSFLSSSSSDAVTPPPPTPCDFCAALSSVTWAANCLSQHIISRDNGGGAEIKEERQWLWLEEVENYQRNPVFPCRCDQHTDWHHLCCKTGTNIKRKKWKFPVLGPLQLFAFWQFFHDSSAYLFLNSQAKQSKAKNILL